MLLKIRYAKKEDIPEKYAELYTEQNGEWVLTGVAGIKSDEDIARVQEGLRKEREDHKETKKKLARFGDMDPDELFQKLDRIDELEAAAGGKLDETKINEMVETRLRSRVAPIERENKQLKADLAERDTTIQEFQSKERTRKITDITRAAAKKAGVRDEAIDDAIMYAERLFEVNEGNEVVSRDGVGITPGISPEVWLTDQRSVKTHWFPESKGSGARGGDGGGFGNNPFSKEHWNMTEQGRLVQTDRAKAEQMAKAAGTTIGGPRPS